VLHALYLPHAHANIVAFLNGEWLGQGGRFSAPSAHVWNRPLFFPFDGARLAHDENVLEVGLQTDGAIFNRLDPPQLGEEALLRPRYERAYALRIPPAEASTYLCAILFVVFGAIGLALRERSYAMLSLASGCYAIASLNCHLVHPPVGTWTFNTVTNLSLQWSGFFLAEMGFVWCSGGAQHRFGWVTAALVGTTGALALCLSGTAFERVMIYGFWAVALYASASFVAIFRARATVPRLEWGTYFAFASTMVPIGIHDIGLLQAIQVGALGPDSVYLAPYFGPILLLAAALSLLIRFIRVYREAQRAKEQFARALAAKTAELEAHYEEMQVFQRAQVLLQERERVMREIHDGVGGHLVAAAALLEQPEVRRTEALQAVRGALDDLRLVVHAMDPRAGDLQDMLSDFRVLHETRLRAQGLSFVWDMLAVAELPRLAPYEALQVVRILQEAITNAVKHARASCITVRCGADAEAPMRRFLEIGDDGEGIRGEGPRGVGVVSMGQRAKLVGGELSLRSGGEGTRVRITFMEAS
jgi:signal transduction histidine kinase